MQAGRQKPDRQAGGQTDKQGLGQAVKTDWKEDRKKIQAVKRAWLGTGRLEARKETEKQTGGQAVRQKRRWSLGRSEQPGCYESRDKNTQRLYYLTVFGGAHFENDMFVLIFSNNLSQPTVVLLVADLDY